MKTPGIEKLMEVARSAKVIVTADGSNEVGSALMRYADQAETELKALKKAAKPAPKKKAPAKRVKK